MASSSNPAALISFFNAASSSNVQSLSGSPASPQPVSSPTGWSPGLLLREERK
jgi:hypothetical protein